MMVMEPRPGVCRRVKPATALPEMPGWSADTRGAHANSPTGCRTGRAGRIRTRALMSASVAPPSRPSGFSSANGRTTTTPAPFRRLPPPLSADACSDSSRVAARFREGPQVLGSGGARAGPRAAPRPGSGRPVPAPAARGSPRQLEEDELGRGSASVAGACCWNAALSAAGAGPAEKIELKAWSSSSQ
uniref:Uncharacterized protein n=1 Tax=Zea mays TaxID=4577 RepID=C0PJB3_MAIZE|nr:unknown [Zea mays]